MADKKKIHAEIKSRLHPKNKHRQRYNFNELIESCPELAPFVKANKYDDQSIDFSNADAVKVLNRALLITYYNIEYWDIPEGYLCPPIPGRADYIHHIADVLSSYNDDQTPTGAKLKCLDIGVGANCVYPIIGNSEYGWSFVGSDIDPISIQSANKIVESNASLKGNVDIRLQANRKDNFYGAITREEVIDLSICNPPFHASLEAAQSGTLRKTNNLTHKKNTEIKKNFGGTNNELWCEGGERRFILDMIRESKKFENTCFLFSSLVSKQSNLKAIYEALKDVEAYSIKTIPMGQGNKSSRIVAWTFLNKEKQITWKKSRWD